jgi:DNA repair exonuclease SbcCD ATPase subunit
MRFRNWVMVLMLAWMHAPASAEIYRYVDEEGGVHYTDDLGKVPVEQRLGVYENAEPDVEQQLGIYENAEPEEDLASEKSTKREGDDVGSHDEVLKEVAPPVEIDILLSEDKGGPRAQDLEETRVALLEEYKALVKGQEEISEAEKVRLGPTGRKKLNEKIREHNKLIDEYEERSQAFLKDVEVFNSRREEEKGLRQKLRETEVKLQEEYETLREEKQEIDRIANEPLTRSARQELAEKLRDYNARVREYKKRKEALAKAIESYNDRIKNEVQIAK